MSIVTFLQRLATMQTGEELGGQRSRVGEASFGMTRSVSEGDVLVGVKHRFKNLLQIGFIRHQQSPRSLANDHCHLGTQYRLGPVGAPLALPRAEFQRVGAGLQTLGLRWDVL